MPFQHACSAETQKLTSITGSGPLLWHASFHLLPSFFYFFFKARAQKDKDRRKDREKKSKKTFEKSVGGGVCGIQTGQLSAGGVSEGESLRAAM